MTKKMTDTPIAKLQELAAEENEALVALIAKLEAGELSATEQQLLSELIPQAKRDLKVLQVAMRHEQFSGPLPHPDQLNKFDSEARQAILAMAQKDQEHTHEMQRKGLEGAIKKDQRGQWLGFTIAVSGLAAAAYVAQTSPAVAGVIAAIDLVSMVAVFVVPRAFEKFGQSKSSDDK